MCPEGGVLEMAIPQITLPGDGTITVCCGPDSCVTVHVSAPGAPPPKPVDLTPITPTPIKPTFLHSDLVDLFDNRGLEGVAELQDWPAGGGHRLTVRASREEPIRLDVLQALVEGSGSVVALEVE